MKFCIIGLGRFGYQVATGLADNGIEVNITFIELLGSATHAYAAYPGVEEALTCELGGQSTVRAGDQLKLGIPADGCHLFDSNGRAFKRHYKMPAQRAA